VAKAATVTHGGKVVHEGTLNAIKALGGKAPPAGH
jgi:hypothetical protein